nr:citrate synthase, mitochondrial [Tanacetum cinerariifolium]
PCESEFIDSQHVWAEYDLKRQESVTEQAFNAERLGGHGNTHWTSGIWQNGHFENQILDGIFLDRLKKIKSEYGKDQLGNITVDMGIHFRGLSIPKCQQVLPAAKPGGEPLPKGLLWLLLTVKVPTKEQVDALSVELRIRAIILDHVYKAIDALPITALLASLFSEAGVIHMNWTSLEHCIECRGLICQIGIV